MSTTLRTHRLSTCDDLGALSISASLDPDTPVTGPDGRSLVAAVQVGGDGRQSIIVRPSQPGDVCSPLPHVRGGTV